MYHETEELFFFSKQYLWGILVMLEILTAIDEANGNCGRSGSLTIRPSYYGWHSHSGMHLSIQQKQQHLER